jgi:formylglycine-generating enzyme required for sulfatase activity
MTLRTWLKTLICVFCVSWTGTAGAQSDPRIAVLELKGKLTRGHLSVMSDKVRSGVLLAMQGKDYVVMSRENMAVLLKDMGLDCDSVEGECEVETGRNIGAAYVVSGAVEDVGGGLLLVSLKVHDTASGALKATGDVRGTEVIQLIDKLPGTVAQVMARAFGDRSLIPMAPAPVSGGAPAQAQFNLNFGSGGGLGVQAKLKEQQCVRQSEQKGSQARAARLADAISQAKSQARRAWQAQSSELEMCTKLERDQRGGCISAVEQWLATARAMRVNLPAGVETVQTDCGARQPAYQADSRTVTAEDVRMAEALLKRLKFQQAGSSGGTNGLGMQFVHIAAGNFMMGSPTGQKNRSTDERQHRVTLTRAFLMQSTEVSQRQWRTVMGTSPSVSIKEGIPLKGGDHPVQNVTWYDAVKFANALSRREGLDPAYSGSGSSTRWNKSANGYRLPTEAEWEYAARAGQTQVFSGTDRESSVCQYSNVYTSRTRAKWKWSTNYFSCEDQYLGSAPVGSLKPNAWGLHDMIGNVWEWTWDRYGASFSSSGVDPTGPSSGSKRSVRGASWCFGPSMNRVSNRAAEPPTNKNWNVGFRLVRSVH